MNINIWDVADDIEQLIQSRTPSTPTISPIRTSHSPVCSNGGRASVAQYVTPPSNGQ